MTAEQWHGQSSVWKRVVLLVACIGLSIGIVWATSGTRARVALQRSVDTPRPGPRGTVELTKKGAIQTFEIEVDQLPGESFGLFLGTNLAFNTNVASFIGPLDGKKDKWTIKYRGEGEAPEQLQVEGVEDLGDMAGLYIFVASPTGNTNITDCVTNIVDGVTNIVDCVTNVFFGDVLRGQVPPLSANPSLFNAKGKDSLTLPDLPPSPKAKGSIKTKFKASQGTSFLDVSAVNLLGGQIYSLCISNSITTNFVSVGEFEAKGRTKVFFRRDTKQGEMLPLLSSTVTNLSGSAIQIKDEFGAIYLEGTIP